MFDWAITRVRAQFGIVPKVGILLNWNGRT